MSALALPCHHRLYRKVYKLCISIGAMAAALVIVLVRSQVVPSAPPWVVRLSMAIAPGTPWDPPGELTPI